MSVGAEMSLSVPGPLDGCRFCSPDLLKDVPVFQHETIVVVQSLDTETWQPLRGQYTLFVPGHHSLTWGQLPEDFQARLAYGLLTVPEFVGVPTSEWPNHNLYLNFGTDAGQTMEHVHANVEIIQPGSPSAGMGPALLRRTYGAVHAAITQAVVPEVALETARVLMRRSGH